MLYEYENNKNKNKCTVDDQFISYDLLVELNIGHNKLVFNHVYQGIFVNPFNRI